MLRATDRCVVAHLADQRFAGRAVATSFLVCRVAPPRPALDVASSDAPLAELRYAELRDDAWTWMTVQGHDRPDADRGFAPATAASALTTALAAAGHRLGHTFRVADGANPGPAVARAALLSDQPSRLSAPRAAVEGRDVLPGRVRPARRWLDTDAARIDPAWRQAGTSLRDPELFVGPRLYSRQTTDRLVVGVVRDDSIALNSVHVIAPLDPHRRGALASIEALCGVLNTPAVASLYRATAPLESAAFPQIRVALLRELPLPWPPPKSIAAAARAWVAQPTDAALAHLDVLVRDWLATTAGKSAGRAG
ncbi:MAG: hypothetical protein H6698_07275 [Myxococcales bacterium]|nr:hypothetical protein [Myxococcales bacterium]